MIKNKLLISPCGNLQEYVDENGCVWIRYRSAQSGVFSKWYKKVVDLSYLV